ncbi:MAG TPA: DegQ family serine endoprotease [Dongiaceae bacterium]|jgi:serine protease Do|nr:DegQ family serine endoprotease [Dongiaceae bacterium]
MFNLSNKKRVARRIGLAATAAAVVALPALVGGLATQGVTVAPARADNAPATQAPMVQMVPASFADLAAKVTPAVVNISSTHVETADDQPDMPFNVPKGSPFEQFFQQFMQQQGKHNPMKRKATALGSGFIVDPSGYIVTNNHVIESATDIQVTTTDGTDYPAKLIGADSKTDLALLKIEPKKPLTAVAFGDSDKARVGDWVLAIGNPFGLGGTVTTGIISARSRDIHEGPFDDFLQIDASINQGNSGGPTFNMNGEVVGINTAIFSPSGGSVGIGFAIPSNLAKPILAELKDKGQIQRGWLGVEIQQVTPEIASAMGLDEAKGALVASVQPDSPAARAQLEPGDVILSFNGQSVHEMRDLPRLVAEADPNSKADLGILRDKKQITVSTTIGKMKDDNQVASNDQQGQDNGQADNTAGVEVAALGATLAPVTQETRQQFNLDENVKGVVVADLDQDGPLADQGIRPGDVIKKVSDSDVQSPADVKRLADRAKADKQQVLLMLVDRGGKSLFVAVKLDNA